jgi:hypothetical protein
MEHLVHGVRDAIDKKTWYPAVALALMLPDVCAAVDQPNARGGHRYRTWVDRYVTKHFCDPNGKPYLNGRELYLFRCAYLHAGEFETDDPPPIDPDDSRAMFEVLNRINLYVADTEVVAARGMTSSSQARSTSYNVGVVEFCDAICKGVEEWLVVARADPQMRERIAASPRIIEIRIDGSQTKF